MNGLDSDASAGHELVEINAPASFLGGPVRLWESIRDHRHILWNFIQRDLRIKYRNSALGYFWSLLEPLMLSAVYYVLFVILSGKAQKEYPLWVLIGVITWGYFSKCLTMALTSLTRNEGMIKQVYFPREIFALTNAGSGMVMAFLSLLVAIPFMVYLGIAPTPRLLLIPVALVMVAMFGVGLGLMFACLNVVNRDVEYLFKFVTRAGMFLSPVMWTVGMMPKSRAGIIEYLLYNPLVAPITMIRNGIDGAPLDVDTGHVLYSLAISLFTFLVGAMVFKRYEATVVKKI